MKSKTIIFILLPFFLVSCQNRLQLKVPKESLPTMLTIDTTTIQTPSVSIIGTFTGKVQVRILFYDSINNPVKNNNNAMVLLDEHTNGGYFKVPEKTAGFKVEFWKKRSYFKNTFYLEKIIIRNQRKTKVINRDSFTSYFKLVNIKYDSITGKMQPITKNPIPAFIYKGSYLNF